MKTADTRRLPSVLTVIGGAGFLGRALIGRIDAGVAVRCLDRTPFPSQAARPPDFTEIVGSSQDPEALLQALEGADAAWIRAGLLGGPQSIEARTCTDYIRENADMVAAVLRACERAGCTRVFYDSSEQVFGEDTERAPAETSSEPVSRNFYGASKLIAEKLLRAWSEERTDAPRSVQIFRYPRIRTADSRDAIFHMTSAAMAGGPICVVGDPDHAINFVDLDDVSASNLAALRRAPAFAIYHVSSGRPISLLQLAVHIQSLAALATGSAAPIERALDEKKISFEPRVLGLSWEGSIQELGVGIPKALDVMIRDTIGRIQENK